MFFIFLFYYLIPGFNSSGVEVSFSTDAASPNLNGPHQCSGVLSDIPVLNMFNIDLARKIFATCVNCANWVLVGIIL